MIVQKLYLRHEARLFLEEIGIDYEVMSGKPVGTGSLLVTNARKGISLTQDCGRYVVKDGPADQFVAFPDHMVFASVRTKRERADQAGGEAPH